MNKEKTMWQGLLEPINPHLCVLLGILDILFGILGLLPGAGSSQAYSLLDPVLPYWIWSSSAIFIGVYLVAIQKRGRISSLVFPMWLNGMLWLFQAGVVLFTDWHSSAWLIMSFIAIYSLFVAANFKVNFPRPEQIST